MIGTRLKGGKVKKASTRDIEEQLLYHKNASGEYDITITDYWDRVVCRMEMAYATHKFSEGARKVVCPFHDDIAPSLGLVKDKETGIEVFNCLGCGAKGTVTTFHEMFFKEIGRQRSNSSVDYFKSLAGIYGVKLESEIIEQVGGKKPAIDFNELPSYSIMTHKANIKKIKENADTLGVSGIAQMWDTLTDKVLAIKQK